MSNTKRFSDHSLLCISTLSSNHFRRTKKTSHNMLHFKHFLAAVLAFAAISTCEIYTLAPSLSGHPLDGQAINAQGRSLFTGFSAPSTYCPVGPNCPQNPLNRTLFAGLMGIYVRHPILYISKRTKLTCAMYRSGFRVVNKPTSPKMEPLE